MPNAGGQAGPSDGLNPNQAAPGSDEQAFDYNSIDPESRALLDAHFEKTFVQGHKAELQKSYEKQLSDTRNELGGQLNLAERNIRELSLFREKAIQYLQGYIKNVAEGRHQPDPRDMAQFLVATQGAVSQATQEDNAWQQTLYQHINKDRTAHESVMQQRSQVTLPDGTRQQVFDPQHPDIQSKFQTYLGRLDAVYKSGSHPDQVLAAEKAFSDYQRTIDRVENEGKFTLLGRARSLNGQSMNDRKTIQAERGSQNLGIGGGGASMTFAQYMEAARSELGESSDHDAVMARAMHRQREALAARR